MKTGWPTKPLAELCEIFADGDWIESKDQSPDGIRLIQTGNVGEGKFKDRAEKARYISEATFRRLRCTEIVEGDCLISRLPDPVGRSCILPDTGERMITAVDCTIVRFKPKECLPEFFNFYSQSDEYLGTVAEECTGTTRNRISRSNLALTPIPVPPLPEQQRIVGILDEAFDGIATAKANAEKNLQNARALFESHLQSVFTQRGEGWVETTLGAEIDLLSGFPFKSAQYTDEETDVRLLRGDNIVQGLLRWDDVKRWPASDTKEYEHYRLCSGDVVLAMDRPWVKAGLKRAQISPEDLPCLLVQRTARLRGNTSLNNRFLVYLIGSGAFTRHILGVQTGIGVPHISGQQIKDFEFLKPPVVDQIRIADNLDSLVFETQRLESLYQQKLAALDALKKSLLHQAFSGQL
jgi:type I restriction enzyme S subunit